MEDDSSSSSGSLGEKSLKTGISESISEIEEDFGPNSIDSPEQVCSLNSVGEPGFWESLIPIWGAGRQAINDFQNGRWGWGLVNSAFAVSDVFLIKSLATGVIRLVGKTIGKEVVETVGREAGEAIARDASEKAIQEVGEGSAKFADDAKLLDHFKRHGGDFGAKTAEEYRQQAAKFLNSPRNEGVLEKIRPNGDVVRYNPSTNEFGVINKDGVIRTYYSPDPAVHGHPTNLDYFNAL